VVGLMALGQGEEMVLLVLGEEDNDGQEAVRLLPVPVLQQELLGLVSSHLLKQQQLLLWVFPVDKVLFLISYFQNFSFSSTAIVA
jgi:hypothetical protein